MSNATKGASSAVAEEIIRQLGAQIPPNVRVQYLCDTKRPEWARAVLVGRSRSIDIVYRAGRDAYDVELHTFAANDPVAEPDTRRHQHVYSEQLGQLLASPYPGSTRWLFEPVPFVAEIRVTD